MIQSKCDSNKDDINKVQQYTTVVTLQSSSYHRVIRKVLPSLDSTLFPTFPHWDHVKLYQKVNKSFKTASKVLSSCETRVLVSSP